jgi:hypothetical protein
LRYTINSRKGANLSKTLIRDSLRAQGINAYIYITMYKASEAKENSPDAKE